MFDDFLVNRPTSIVYTVVPQYRPSVNRLPSPIPLLRWPPPLPNTAADFQVPNMFFLGYTFMTPFTAVFQYRRFLPVPRAAVLGGLLY